MAVHPSVPNAGKRVHLLTPDELLCPPTAWPTVILFLVAYAVYLSPILLHWNQPSIQTTPFSALAIYVLFTPFHDAIHRAISREHRGLNELIGHLSGIVFLAPLPSYRHIHLSHHKYTNDPVKDPDMWSAGWHSTHFTSYLALPLFWATQVFYGYVWYLKGIRTRPKHEQKESIVIATVMVFSFLSILFSGYRKQFFYFFWVPHVLAVTFLSYSFDYAPHRPHDGTSFDYAPHRPHDRTREEDIYKTTSMIAGLVDPDDGVDLTWPLLWQNYHVIHHLYPMIPFFKYHLLWLKHSKELKKLGVPVTTYLGPFFKLPQRQKGL